MKYRTTSLSAFACVLVIAIFGVGADNSGCESTPSSSVKSESIRTNYWMFYKSETDTSYARAQFRVGNELGTTLELKPPAGARFDGRPLAWNATLDWYEVNLAGKVTTGKWTFEDNEGKPYVNELPRTLEARVPLSFPERLLAAEAYSLEWEGEPIQEGETMEAIVAHDENRLQFVAIFEKSVGAKNVVIAETELARLPRGRSAIALQRHRDYPLQQGTETGGKITTTFESPVRIFDLE